MTQLPEICERLQSLHSEKFGHGVVKILQDSKKVQLTILFVGMRVLVQLHHHSVIFTLSCCPVEDCHILLRKSTHFAVPSII